MGIAVSTGGNAIQGDLPFPQGIPQDDGGILEMDSAYVLLYYNAVTDEEQIIGWLFDYDFEIDIARPQEDPNDEPYTEEE